MNQLKNFLNDEMDDDAMENFTENIMFQKFDAEKRQIWSQILKEKYGVERNKKPGRVTKLFTIRRVLSAAAAITLLFGAFFFINKSTLPLHQELAQAYVDELPIHGDPNIDRKGEGVEAVRANANEAYMIGDYETAIEYLTQLRNQQLATPYNLFYLGVCHLRKDESEPQTAIALLLEVQPKVSELRQEINWALSLAYVRSGQEEKARPILESIVAGEEFMNASAKELLEALDKEN